MKNRLDSDEATAQNVSDAHSAAVLRFLVVDDHDDVRQALVRMVERLGHAAVPAADGAEALELLATERYDFMLLDVTMPRMSGQDVLRWLGDHPEWAQGLRVVVVSAWAARQRRELEELGARTILPKPLRAEQLRDLIAEAVPAPRR